MQVRIKGSSDAAVLAECEQILAAAQKAQAVVIVNDRADIALAVGADGVHGGADDLPVPVLRRVVGPTGWWGARPETPTQHFVTKPTAPPMWESVRCMPPPPNPGCPSR